MLHPEPSGISGLSIVCVFNDLAVREHCLDRSIQAYSGPVQVEYIPLDNREHTFTSAGAALNHGARQAAHEVVVLVHQDVYLHSLDKLAGAAAAFADPTWGVLGANGVTHGGTSTGRLRDRVLLIGESAQTPVEVDSLDEVLFMARRSDLVEHPLSEDPDLAWHAYAVEYGLRMRSLGMRVGAVDTAITHNSLTINLARLMEAHQRVGVLHPQFGPIVTTCGTIGSPRARWRTWPILRDHGWRWRWLRQSLKARRARQALPATAVLSDLNHEVDLLSFSSDAPLHVLNLDRAGGFSEVEAGPVTLERRGRPLVMRSFADLQGLREELDSLPRDANVVVTGLTTAELEKLAASRATRDWLIGIQWDEAWVVAGPAALEPPPEWTSPQAVPWGGRVAKGSRAG